jgi:hypothetical protein
MIFPLIFLLPLPFLWLLCIRPYCIRHGKGYTPGATMGVTFWVDWQEAREIAREKGDKGMTLICGIVLWLQILVFLMVLLAIFR